MTGFTAHMKTEPAPRVRPYALRQNRIPILRHRPRLEVAEGDVARLTVEGGAIHRIPDTPSSPMRWRMTSSGSWSLATGRPLTRERNGDDVIPRKLVAREVEAPARAAAGVFEDANGDRPDVHDGIICVYISLGRFRNPASIGGRPNGNEELITSYAWQLARLCGR